MFYLWKGMAYARPQRQKRLHAIKRKSERLSKAKAVASALLKIFEEIYARIDAPRFALLPQSMGCWRVL
jgi:hypothetical protein